jgi:SAM-dependent methyltransferase
MRDHFQESPRSYSEEWVGWCCSYCGAPLVPRGSGLFCREEERWFATRHGVHLLLPEERRQSLLAFRDIRRRLGRVPARRGREEEERRRHVAEALSLVREALGPAPWYVLAAGDGPVARSLRAGHRVVVVSSKLAAEDGHDAEGPRCPRAEAELDALPLEPGRADLVLAEGSLHEGHSLARTLVELRRVVRRGGVLLALDSPVFRRRAHGEGHVAQAMKEERALVGMAVPRESRPVYLVRAELGEQFGDAGWSLQVLGWPGAVLERTQDLLRLVRGARPAARFPVLLARRDG